MRIGIIGTAGRSNHIERVNHRHLWNWMVNRTYSLVVDLLREKDGVRPVFVSGGAAWADHVAVALHLRGLGDLEIHLPAELKDLDGDRPYFDPASRAGEIANHYHAIFSERVWDDVSQSRRELARVRESHVMAPLIPGVEAFKQRNLEIGAKLDYLIALTFGRSEPPHRSGTGHCWKNARLSDDRKIHISLLSYIRRLERAKEK